MKKFFSIKFLVLTRLMHKIKLFYLHLLLLNKLALRNPTKNISNVPNTIARLACTKGDITIQQTRITPQTTPSTASKLRAFLEIYPNRNSPNMPPLKIDANAHQTSSALCTLIKAKPPEFLPLLLPLESFSTNIRSLFPACLRNRW